MPPEICPVCGQTVPPDARVCPQCGSDDETGWSEDARRDELGLPDEDFDYDRFVKEEFGPREAKPRGIPWFWWAVAVGILGAIAWFWLKGVGV